jgi:transcriptional regulator with XRE-family HTH domain
MLALATTPGKQRNGLAEVAFLSPLLYFGLMGFVSLQEGLRRELRRRMAAGELTGMQLARKSGFTQAHISNFINGKRGLKLRALDRMLKSLGLTLYALLEPGELSRHAPVATSTADEFIDVPLVEAGAAMCSVIVRDQAKQMLKFRCAFLKKLKLPRGAAARKTWTRFVSLQIEPNEAEAMWPRAGSRATVLVDRHYTSLEPYRSGRRNIYVLKPNGGILVRYAELLEGSLVLQSRDPSFPAVVLSNASPAEQIVGRVAQVSLKV